MLSKPLGKLGFGNFAICKLHHQRRGFLFAGNDLPAILLKKDIHQNKSHSFITVDKGMIPADVEPISRVNCRYTPAIQLARLMGKITLWINE